MPILFDLPTYGELIEMVEKARRNILRVE